MFLHIKFIEYVTRQTKSFSPLETPGNSAVEGKDEDDVTVAVSIMFSKLISVCIGLEHATPVSGETL